jgi:hypothetical protein
MIVHETLCESGRRDDDPQECKDDAVTFHANPRIRPIVDWLNTMSADTLPMTRRLLAAGILPLLVSACSSGTPPPTKHAETIVWRPVGAWSGQGNRLTEAFVSDTGTLRFRWETRSRGNEGRGRFRLTLNSGVSGRVIATVADEKGGEGSGQSIVRDDPRMYYATVESADLDWRFGIEEGVRWTVDEPRAK